MVTALVKLTTQFSLRNFKFPGPEQRATPVPSDIFSLVRFVFQLLPLEAEKREAVALLFLHRAGCEGDVAYKVICEANGDETQNVAVDTDDSAPLVSPETQPEMDQDFGTESARPGTRVVIHLARENVSDLYLGIIDSEQRKSNRELTNATIFKNGRTHDIATRHTQLTRYFSKEGCAFDLALVWKGCGDLKKSLQNYLARHRFFGFKGQREIFCASGLCKDQIVQTTLAVVELLRRIDDTDEPLAKRFRSDVVDLLQLEKEKTAQETERTKQIEAAEKTKQVEAAEKTKQAAEQTRQSDLQNQRLKLLADKGATAEQLFSLLTLRAACG